MERTEACVTCPSEVSALPSNGNNSSSNRCSREEHWVQDRLVLANQIENLLVAIRSDGRFVSKTRFTDAGRITDEHPLLRNLKLLQRKVMLPSLVRHISEEEILQPFCDLSVSPDMGDTIIGVVLASLSNIVDTQCSFITRECLEKLLFSTRGRRSGISGNSSYEVVLSRRLQLCVSCTNHPCARELPERLFVKTLRRAYALAVHPSASQLLQRTAEQAMKSIISSLYNFILQDKLNHGRSDRKSGVHQESALNGVSVLRFICRLISGIDEEEDNWKENSRSDVRVSSRNPVVQLEGLFLVQTMLFIVKDHLCKPGWEDLLYGVQHNLSRVLLVAGVSTENVIVLSQILRTVHIVMSSASSRLVPQIYSFIRVLHIGPIIRMTDDLRSDPSSPKRVTSSPRTAASPSLPTTATFHMSVSKMHDLCERRELLLESLVEFCCDSDFAAFCYAQYDLSRRFLPLFSNLCNVLVENCFHLSDSSFSVNVKGGHDGITNDLWSEGVFNQTDILALEALNGLLFQTALTISRPEPPLEKLSFLIESRLEEKKLLRKFASLFRTDAIKEGIPFLLQNATRFPVGIFKRGKLDAPALLIEEPAGGRQVGACLFRLNDILDKRALGEYLGELGRESPAPVLDGSAESETLHSKWKADRQNDHLRAGTVRFFEEQLKGFLDEFDYRNKSLLSCIRETAYRMCMPGEAQKIDRVMEAFAKKWNRDNRDSDKTINPFSTEHGAFILAFSLIMLNTDQHSGKMVKPMTQEDFRRIHRDSDGGNSLPDEFLNELFDDVRTHPIIMADMIDTGFTNDVTWELEMLESSPLESSKFSDVIKTFSMHSAFSDESNLSFIHALQPFVFQVLWKDCLTAFSNTLHGCRAPLENYITKEKGTNGNTTNNKESSFYPPEYAYHTALDGLSLTAKTAAHYGVVAAVDHVILNLIAELPLDMQDAHNSLMRLGNQTFSLRCLEKLFHVLNECKTKIMDAWKDLGYLFTKLFLLGVFARELEKTSETVALWEELYSNPGIISFGVKRAQSEGGWLSALWGSTSSSSPERLKEQEGEEKRAMERIQVLIPSIEEFLQMIDNLEEKSHQLFFSALCESTSLKSKKTSESYSISYTMILVTEVIIRRSGDAINMDRYIKLCHQLTSVIFTILDQPKDVRSNSMSTRSRGIGSEDDLFISEFNQPMTSEAYKYWISIGNRIVRAILRAIKQFSSNTSTHGVAIRLLNMLTNAPVKAFNAIVAPELSSTLLDILENPQYLSTPPSHEYLEGLLNALRVTSTTCGIPRVQWKIRKSIAALVKLEKYDPLQDSDAVINTLVLCALSSPTTDGINSEVGTETDEISVYCEPVESFADSITSVCRRLAVMNTINSTIHGKKNWEPIWISSLRGLSALVVLSRHYRDRSDALLCLQRCLLDSEIRQLPGAAVALLYEDVIFPLTEQMCAPSSDTLATPQNEKVNDSDNTNTDTRPVQSLVAGFFSTLAPVPLSKRETENTTGQLRLEKSKRKVAIDLKCRMVALLPKVLLHYVKSLGDTPEILQELSQRILGTLYALYTVPNDMTTNEDESDTREVGKEIIRVSGTTEDEAALREAIQETVKNMINVLESTLADPECMITMQKMPYFWTSTKNVLRTFDFAESLLALIDSRQS
ncbi:Guanine nucleotide exchange factor [Trypanosoma melophagium]|uniref:Guanine nucleotide exchange factor n=1 Tax=Trypanosoma melophagium TaxID=715481 RepID=UPI00351A8550|nr:Guanine nucleotide exchange factor [Trypanosoma melophagium]